MKLLDNPTSNLLALVTVVTVLRQGWDVLYWIVIIPYRCCNKLQPTTIDQTVVELRKQTVKHECASVHIVKQETATFQTKGPGSVHLYATHHILTCIIQWHYIKLWIPVRQSNIQLTCCSYRRNSVKTRLRCSILNCDYTLQVLQQVATND